MARKNREKGGDDENGVAVAGEALRKQTEGGDGEQRGTPEERAGVEADALIAVAEERTKAAQEAPADFVHEDFRGVPMPQTASQDAPFAAMNAADLYAEAPAQPLKRKPIISVMGTDKATGERSILHRARSRRAARRWGEQARFLLSRLYTNLTVAVTREEDL